MANTLVPQKQITYPKDFSYVQPRSYPLLEIRRVEEHLFAGFLQELPGDENENRNLPTKPGTKADLPLASDYGEIGYESLLPIRGTLKKLQYR